MLSEIDSFNKTLRRTVFFITFVGILTSTFLATFVFKTLSKRINVTAQYIVNMKANLVHERLTLQSSQLTYLSRIKSISGIQELKSTSKHQLFDRLKKEQIGLYWISQDAIKEDIPKGSIDKVFEATQFSSNEHLQIESSIKKILKENGYEFDDE